MHAPPLDVPAEEEDVCAKSSGPHRRRDSWPAAAGCGTTAAPGAAGRAGGTRYGLSIPAPLPAMALGSSPVSGAMFCGAMEATTLPVSAPVNTIGALSPRIPWSCCRRLIRASSGEEDRALSMAARANCSRCSGRTPSTATCRDWMAGRTRGTTWYSSVPSGSTVSTCWPAGR